MKKIIAAFIAGALVATVSSVYGESVFKPIKETVYSRSDIKMTLNGELLHFENTIIEYDHKTFFPVRELANKLGATVDWDEKNQTIVLEKEVKNLNNTENKDDNTSNEIVALYDYIKVEGEAVSAIQYNGQIYISAKAANLKHGLSLQDYETDQKFSFVKFKNTTRVIYLENNQDEVITTYLDEFLTFYNEKMIESIIIKD